MSLYMPRAARALVNQPLAMSENQVFMLMNAVGGDETGLSRVNGTARVREVDAEAALARLRGAETHAGGRAPRPYAMSTSGIAHIIASGDMVRTADIWDRIFGGVTSYEDIASQILFANEDSECRGIFFQVSSYGGLCDGMVECSDFIHSMSARNGGKPIFGYAAGAAASAAFLQLSACDRVFCGETDTVGSIGCMAIYLDRSEMLAEAGITPTVFRSRPGKNRATGIETLPEGAINHIQDQIDYLGSVFEKRVALYMPSLSQSAVAETNALDYIGPRAKAIGLVNDVLSMPEAWAKLERRIAR